MRVLVGNQIRITKPNPEVLMRCRNTLVIANPDFAKKKRMGFWTGNTPERLQLYEMDGDTLVLPFGCLRWVMECMGGKDSIELNMTQPQMIWYGCDVSLYDYQREAVAQMLEAQYGILQAPAGCGKTQMGIAMAVTLGRKTLWLTHTKDLLSQSKARAEQYMSPDLTGTITEGRVQIGKGITFATVQTMCNLNLALYRDTWDCVIVDECHRVAGSPTAVTQFSKVLNALAARHKYGLSATVHRADGMIAATYALLGEVVYKVPEAAVAEKIMRVNVRPVECTEVGIVRDFLDTDGTIIYSKLINYLAEDFERNGHIIGEIIMNEGHSCLILSDRLAHLEYLMNHLPRDMRAAAVMVDGKMTTKKGKMQREQAIEDMRQGRKKYLFATYALAKEGLDIPCLDRLFLTTPQKDYAVITQSIGRIARTAEGKEDPIVYDFVDTRVKYLVKSYKKRCTTYRKAGCRFIE